MPEESPRGIFNNISPTPQKTQLQIEFGGLCAHVENDGVAHVLLIAASRTPVTPKLCLHRRFLVFPGDKHTLLGIEGEDFYTSFVDVEGRPWNAWDIDGYELELNFYGDPLPEPAISEDASFDQVLDFDPLAGSIDPKWLSSPLDEASLVGSRFRFETGIWSGGKLVGEDWALCVSKKDCDPKSGRRFSETIRCQIPKISDVTEICGTHHESGKVCKIRLDFGARVAVSNLCPVTPTELESERDVLAYYELAAEPRASEKRVIPFSVRRALLGFRVPGQSACPPAKMALQVGG